MFLEIFDLKIFQEVFLVILFGIFFAGNIPLQDRNIGI